MSTADPGSDKAAMARRQRAALYRKLRQLGMRALAPLQMRRRQANVVMFHVGRSGSTVLGDLIGQHPGVYWDGEIYEHRVFQPYEQNNGTIEYGRTALSYDPVPLLRARMREAGSRIYGFEAKFFHLDYTAYDLDAFLATLRSLGFKHFIVLERRNLLRKIASSVAAHERSEFHIKASANAGVNRIHLPVDAVRIDRNCKPLREFLAGYTRDLARLERSLSADSMLKLTYEEDIASDPAAAYRRVCDFLDLTPVATEVRLAKTNPYPLADMLENFDEVSAALRDTEFAWMLDD
ncbi:MAG: hypothetical protein HKO62_13035 [Gammaproteobacteria bacterium]|nr:sulfotransferase [Gammaproteobacteria bacterium]NNM01670.1 hypothetical protein [Gammaproteobacteria bacterium]